MSRPGPARWFRFSLSTIFLLTALVALPLGIWAHAARAKRENDIVASWNTRNRGIGVSAMHDYYWYGPRMRFDARPRLVWLRRRFGNDYFDRPVQLTFITRKLTDRALAPFASLSEVHTVQMYHPSITDAGLMHLKSFRKLRILLIHNAAITDAGMQHVGAIKTLESLVLNDCPLTDAGLAHLHGLTNLRDLRLGGTAVSDQAIEELQRALPKVEYLPTQIYMQSAD